MKEQFVTYEIASKLKELGFSEPCLAWYLPEIAEKGNICTPILGSYAKDWNKMFKDRLNCPLWQQVIDWFREKYNIYIAVISYTNPVKIGNKLMFEILIGNKENGFDPSIDNSIKRLKTGYENKEFSYYNLYKTYEEAREQAILKAIELCQNKK